MELYKKTVTDSSISKDNMLRALVFDSLSLKNTPGTLNDLNRVLSSNVSVKSPNALSNNTLFIRGGKNYENRYFLNEIEFDNLNHFSIGSHGAMGFISLNTLKKAEIFAGAAPGKYSLSPSAAIVVSTRSGTSRYHRRNTELSIAGGELLLEGPLGFLSGSYLYQIRYFDSRPLKQFITTGQVPRFVDACFSIDFNHSQNFYSRVFGVFAWDKMNTRNTSNSELLDKLYRNGMSYTTNIRHRNLMFESGVTGQFSTEKKEFTGYKKIKSHMVKEISGRAYTRLKISPSEGSHFETGADVKIINSPREVQMKNHSAAQTDISGVRVGGFAEFSKVIGHLNGFLSLRYEYWSIFTSNALSPQLGVTYDIGPRNQLSINAAIKHGSQDNLTELHGFLYYDSTDAPFDLRTLHLKRVWYGDVKAIHHFKQNLSIEGVYYAKLYDREFKIRNGINRAYYGGTTIKSGKEVYTFIQPEGKRFAHGIELNLIYDILNKFKCFFGSSIESIKHEYTDGQFYPDQHSVGLNLKSSIFWTLFPRHMVSFSVNASQGRRVWKESQIESRRYFSSRLPNMYSINGRYSFDILSKKTVLKLFIEVNNILNQTPPVYQQLYTNGSMEYYSMNGIFPLAGVRWIF